MSTTKCIFTLQLNSRSSAQGETEIAGPLSRRTQMQRTKGQKCPTPGAFIPSAWYLEQSCRRTVCADTGTSGEASRPRATKALEGVRCLWNSVLHVLSPCECNVREHQSNGAHQFFRSIGAEIAHPSVLAHHVRQQTLNKYKCHHSIQRLHWDDAVTVRVQGCYEKQCV